MGSTDSLEALARPLVAEVGLELWDVEVTPSVVRILVDRPAATPGPGGHGQGVDLDSLTAATKALSFVLDDRDDLVPSGRYDLEVSSPGIERSLRTPEQYRRYLGSVLNVKTTVAVAGSRRLRATLVGTDDQAVELLVDGSSTPITVPLEHIERARTVLEWGRAGSEGHKRRPGGGGDRRAANEDLLGANEDEDEDKDNAS